MSPEGDEARRRATLERILATAALHRRRGDREAAWRAADDALALQPNSAAVFELMGDLNGDGDDWAAAQQCYRRALELEPGRPGSEVGLGRSLLMLEAGAEPTELLTEDRALAGRTPEMAALRSLLLPGLGQAYAGEMERGLAFMVPAFIGALVLVYQLTGAPAALRAMFKPDGSPFAIFGALGLLGWLAVVLLSVLQAYAALDAYNLLKERQPPKVLS